MQLGRSGKPREAMLQLAEMARLGVQPDNIAATALLDACARNRKMEMASSVFEELFGTAASSRSARNARASRARGDYASLMRARQHSERISQPATCSAQQGRCLCCCERWTQLQWRLHAIHDCICVEQVSILRV